MLNFTLDRRFSKMLYFSKKIKKEGERNENRQREIRRRFTKAGINTEKVF